MGGYGRTFQYGEGRQGMIFSRMLEGDVPYALTVWGFGVEFFAHVASSELAEGAAFDLESAQSGVEPREHAGCWTVNGGVRGARMDGECSRPMRSRT